MPKSEKRGRSSCSDNSLKMLKSKGKQRKVFANVRKPQLRPSNRSHTLQRMLKPSVRLQIVKTITNF